MSQSGNPAETGPEFSDDVADELPDGYGIENESDKLDPFGQLVQAMGGGERLHLTRNGPSNLPKRLRGWLETMEVPDTADAGDILDLVKQKWGGGTYTLKRLARAGHRQGFLKGAAVLEIAGAPLDEGRRVDLRTGETIEPAPPVRIDNPAPSMVVHHPAPAASPDAGVVAALTNALVAAKQGGKELGIADLVTLAQKLIPPPQPQQQRTPLQEIKQYVGFLGELQDLLGPREAAASSSSDLGVPKSMEEAFMQFFNNPAAMSTMMGGQSSQQSPQWGPPSGPMQQPPPPVGPPGALWDPRRGVWVNPSAPPPPSQPQPQPPTPPDAAASAPADDEWEEEPITADMVVETLRDLPAEERRKFIERVQSELGPSVVDQFRQSLAES